MKKNILLLSLLALCVSLRGFDNNNNFNLLPDELKQRVIIFVAMPGKKDEKPLEQVKSAKKDLNNLMRVDKDFYNLTNDHLTAEIIVNWLTKNHSFSNLHQFIIAAQLATPASIKYLESQFDPKKMPQKEIEALKGIYIVQNKKHVGLTPMLTTTQNKKDAIDSLLQNTEKIPALALEKAGVPVLCGTLLNHTNPYKVPETELIQTLINFGLDVNKNHVRSNGKIVTPLMLSAENSWLEIVKLLIKNGACVTTVNMKGETALMFASHTVSTQSYEIVKALLDSFKNKQEKIKYMNMGTNNSATTALMIASNKSMSNIVELLIKNDAGINLVTKDNKNALIAACSSEKSDLQTVKTLVKNGVKLDIQDSNGLTALMHACLNGYDEIARYLIDNDADVSIKNEKDRKKTALHYASKVGFESIVNYLIENGASVKDANENDETPLQIASQYGHYNTVKNLILYKSEVNKVCANTEYTPLHCASSYAVYFKNKKNDQIPSDILSDFEKTVEVLLNANANPNIQSGTVPTPLMLAAIEGLVNIAKILVEKGKADVNLVNLNNQTALLYAVSHEHYDMVEYLLSVGADINAKDGWGKTALDIANNYSITKERYYVDENDIPRIKYEVDEERKEFQEKMIELLTSTSNENKN